MSKTVRVSEEVHERLQERKLVDRESFGNVIERLLEETKDEDEDTEQ